MFAPACQLYGCSYPDGPSLAVLHSYTRYRIHKTHSIPVFRPRHIRCFAEPLCVPVQYHPLTPSSLPTPTWPNDEPRRVCRSSTWLCRTSFRSAADEMRTCSPSGPLCFPFPAPAAPPRPVSLGRRSRCRMAAIGRTWSIMTMVAGTALHHSRAR